MAPWSGLLQCPVRGNAMAAQDLHQIQRVVIAPDGRQAYCCCQEGPCHVIAVATGETTERLRGVRRVWVDSSDGLRLQQSSTLAVVDRFGEKLFGITPSSPRSVAVLDASFSRRYLAISEPGSDVRIFELPSGREVARHVQPKNHHVLWLSAFSGGSLFHGVQWHYQTGGPRRLFRFRATQVTQNSSAIWVSVRKPASADVGDNC